jgi:quercetin dioxygenase-like cupin family protein
MSASDAPQVLHASDAALVRILSLAPHEIGRAHHHRTMTETIVCLEGTISLFVAGREPQSLATGMQTQVEPLVKHHVRNDAALPARYLLVQSGGAYDFITD